MDTVPENEASLLAQGKPLLADLISHDDWLPQQFALPDPERYQQNLLYCDPAERFSVVSFVWGAGQRTPVHDHTVWGMIGLLRGAEVCEEFDFDNESETLRKNGEHLISPGEIDLVSPRIGDIHRVSNPQENQPAISIHIYGGNIGTIKRHIYTDDGVSSFVSAYSNRVLPNIWE